MRKVETDQLSEYGRIDVVRVFVPVLCIQENIQHSNKYQLLEGNSEKGTASGSASDCLILWEGNSEKGTADGSLSDCLILWEGALFKSTILT